MCTPLLGHELQQDQSDLTEGDPEENTAEFMGILIKVHSSGLLNVTHTVNSKLSVAR